MEQKLFLAAITIYYTPYMGEQRSEDSHRIVWASSSAEARTKIHQFFEDKAERTGDSYYASINDLSEAIS